MDEFLIVLIISFAILCDLYLRARIYKGPISDHFDGKHFKNISNGKKLKSRFYDRAGDELVAFPFILRKLRTTWSKKNLPNGRAIPVERVFGREIVVTFINHSTVLIQTEGLNILTDPVWAKRASPFPFIGGKRYMDPGVLIDSLPRIDFILLTHNHYDHMDTQSLKKIVKRDLPTIYMPLGNSKTLIRSGIFTGIEMDWGDNRKFSEQISIDCVPAQHFSARALSDRNRNLWGGFVVKTPHGDIYFAGDTGYGVWTQTIKKTHPNGFRLAFLPIGVFEPKLFMKEMHMSPDDAINVCRELKINHAVGIHFGTFDLGLDKQDEPVEKIKELLQKDENKDIKFTTLWNGESIKII